jgi:hypothetical protein
VRLERHQGEYWVLGLMLASYKKMYSELVPDAQLHRNLSGYCADYLMRNVERIPDSVLPPSAKSAATSTACWPAPRSTAATSPAASLWLRTRNGYYTINPELAVARQQHRRLAALEAVAQPAAGVGRLRYQKHDLIVQGLPPVRNPPSAKNWRLQNLPPSSLRS